MVHFLYFCDSFAHEHFAFSKNVHTQIAGSNCSKKYVICLQNKKWRFAVQWLPCHPLH
jgi:hypothetical protein